MISIAIPTLDGAADLDRILSAVRRQTIAAEIVILDSGSSDDTRDIGACYGAAIHIIDRRNFRHGRSRNELMRLTTGERVAFLTQDAEPADERWLERLLELDVALTYGPYRAGPSASAAIRREYAEFFGAMESRTWRIDDLHDPPGPGPSTFVSSANMCLSRSAWERVPFRDVPYAEDQHLGLDLLRAGYERSYVPDAAVLHSHDYGPVERLRRYFDEFRALHDVYGWTAPSDPRTLLGTVRTEVGRDRRFGAGDGELAHSIAYHGTRVLGAALGTRAERLPATVRRRLSLEGRY